MTQASLKKKSSDLKLPLRPLKLWQDISSNQEVRIEILPMIDVIFCILTFFILAAVGFSRQQAINLNLPQANTGRPQMREMLVVSLDQQGQLYLEKQPVTQVQLYSALSNYHSLNPTGLMVLHASKDVSYNEVIQVLDLLKEVGGDRVALATLAGESQKPAQTVSPYPGFNPYYPSYNYTPNYPGAGYNFPNSPYPTTPSTPNESPTPPSPPEN